MATETVMTGDTVRVKGAFTDWAPEGEVGDAIDPDSNVSTWTVYNSDLLSIATGTAVRQDIGIYYYDWTIPLIEGNYIVEIKGNIGGLPQLNRQKYRVKFKPVA